MPETFTPFAAHAFLSNRPLSPCSLLTCVWAILVGPGQGHERSGTDGEKEDRAGGGEAVLA
jgi:hypothetical protein